MAGARIGVLLGSDSDLPRMAPFFLEMNRFGMNYEAVIASAHRDPERVASYSREAADRGIQVLVAAAGMAAHLAGAVAAHTVLPVIGVPLSGSALSGMDSLYSTVQMPPGVPVATVAIDGAANAAFLAAQILALSDPALREALQQRKTEMRDAVREKDRKLQSTGPLHYEKGKGR